MYVFLYLFNTEKQMSILLGSYLNVRALDWHMTKKWENYASSFVISSYLGNSYTDFFFRFYL